MRQTTPGSKKLDHPRAQTTAMRPNGTVNIDPQEKLKNNK